LDVYFGIIYTFYWRFELKLWAKRSFTKFTVWNLIFQAIFFSLSIVTDVLILLKRKDLLKLEKYQIFYNSFFHVNLVMSLAIGCLFWPFNILAPEAILPRAYGIPKLFNHMQHSFPVATILLDLVLKLNSKYTKIDTKFELESVLFITISYLTTVYIAFKWKRFWPYPFLESFSDFIYLIFAIGSIFLAIGFHHIVHQIRQVHRVETENTKIKTK